MNARQVEEARRMWESGVKAQDIADAVGLTLKQFEGMRRKQRSLFPFRSQKDRVHSAFLTAAYPDVKKERRNNVMIWKTHCGIDVSLPRVSILTAQM